MVLPHHTWHRGPSRRRQLCISPCRCCVSVRVDLYPLSVRVLSPLCLKPPRCAPPGAGRRINTIASHFKGVLLICCAGQAALRGGTLLPHFMGLATEVRAFCHLQRGSVGTGVGPGGRRTPGQTQHLSPADSRPGWRLPWALSPRSAGLRVLGRVPFVPVWGGRWQEGRGSMGHCSGQYSCQPGSHNSPCVCPAPRDPSTPYRQH